MTNYKACEYYWSVVAYESTGMLIWYIIDKKHGYNAVQNNNCYYYLIIFSFICSYFEWNNAPFLLPAVTGQMGLNFYFSLCQISSSS
jgi:hypothetical protein